MKNKIVLLIALMCTLATLQACGKTYNIMNIKNDGKAEQALLNYLKAGDESNVTILDQLTYKNYRVIYHDIAKGEISEINKAVYLDLIGKKVFGGTPRMVEILSKNSSNNTTASFKVKTTSSGGTFISYFSLIRYQNEWLVLQDLIYKSN